MASLDSHFRVLITCRSCKLTVWASRVVITLTTGTSTRAERNDWLENLESELFGNARKAVDDHRARHLLSNGMGAKLDVQCLPDRGEREEEVSA